MCGRFVGSFSIAKVADEIASSLGAAGVALGLFDEVPSMHDFNVAPTRLVPTLRIEDGSLMVEPMVWGLVPSWSKDPTISGRLINARSETVTEKPSFRNLVPSHRCIVPMNGFYEWDRTDPKKKIPYFVPRADGRLMLTMGLWSRPAVLDGLATCCILTTASGPDLVAIHDRAPVQTTDAEAVEWMLPGPAPLEVLAAGRPLLAPRRVSPAVNSVRNNSPQLLDAFVGESAERTAEEQPGLFD